MVRADCAFRMGRGHLICEDYAVARGGEHACALLADGCSSSPDTDVGARLLALSALPLVPRLPAPARTEADNKEAAHEEAAHEEAINENEAGEDESGTFAVRLNRYHRDSIVAARRRAQELGMANEALDATLLTLAAQGGRWFASLFGDGVVVATRADGGREVTDVSYRGGYPYYPNYLADAARRHALLQMRDNLRRIETFTLLPDGAIEDRTQHTGRADAPCPTVTGSISAYRHVVLLSDGVHSFTQAGTGRADGAADGAPVALAEALRELTAFKTTTGQFAQRRMQRFQQTCVLSGWQHHDDISLAALAFG